MSRNNDADVDPLPDEPPPPYEPLGAASDQTESSAVPASSAPATSNVGTSTANTSTNGSTSTHSAVSHNPFLSPEEHPTGAGTTGATAASPNPASSTNPFLTAVTLQQTGASTTSSVTTPAGSATTGQAPSLPPRTYTAPQSPPPSQPEATRPSLDSRHSRPSSITSPTSPTPASPSIYAPPSGPPPPPASSLTHRPGHTRNDLYRPTTVPTPGQPLLRKGKLLVYPRDWRGCPKCNDTGYKHGDPNNPHKSCWDKYGKTYTSAMSYSVGLNGATSHFQKPLPVVGGPPMGAMTGGRPSLGHVAGGYPGSAAGGYAGPAPVQQGYGGYGGYMPPVHAPPPHAPPPVSTTSRPPASPSVDAETEGARMSDVPPNYQDASNVNSDERLPSQYVPPPVPPPGHGPPPPQPRPPSHNAPYGQYEPGPSPYGPPPPGGFVGDFGPNPGGPNPYVSVQPMHQPWYGSHPPPPNALVVMPGDPRIGGRLCYECGGRGIIESFWLGDEMCFRCRGSGRVF
ncbi:uncharacterized protein SPSC_06158 [Sporisorium scitamineum]|uniref:Proline-rich protein HUA1 n=1 Tax=Sporisorium scitamineum TaxID=49012 RepID=A0A0F7RS47_9BASI|nr:hypothetical protein [Sporisorium scitamineum]CDU25987.1 uncharacterized protein SPSC_06158 [Sporisorium scitamineum]